MAEEFDNIFKDVVEYKNLPEDLKKDPYNYICDWAENLLPYVGKKCFKIISLMPISIISPDLTYKGETFRSNINVLLLTSPGGGKSTISKEFAKTTYNPLKIRSITPARLEKEIKKNPVFSLIVEDYYTMSREPIIGKIIEGILGEEKNVQRATVRKTIDVETNGVGLLCGVPTDLHEYLSGGLIFRLIPIVIFHDEKEHSEIGRRIAEGIGSNGNSDNRYEHISNLYKLIYNVQQGVGPINPITGFNISEEFKTRAFEKWDKITRQIYRKSLSPLNWFRSLQEFFRVLVCHAMLNVFNREVKEGILTPNEEDFNIAIGIMEDDLKVKFKLISMDVFVKNLTSLTELQVIMNSEKFTKEQKELIKHLINKKRALRK